MRRWRIVADVGGTNTRIAATDEAGHADCVRSYSTYDGASFTSALVGWLADTGRGAAIRDCDGVCIAAAGPVDGGTVTLTNGGLRIDAGEVSASLGGVGCHLVNDLTAVAMLLPHLGPDGLIGTGAAGHGAPRTTRLAVNLGTGFGAAAAIPDGHGGWVATATEAGHMTLALTRAEDGFGLETLGSVEDVLSGRGLPLLYERLAARGGEGRAAPDLEAMFAGIATDPIAGTVEEITTRLLGRIAGDLVLATGAWGGCFLCGSVATGWAAAADLAKFREAFESKGPMRSRMCAVPVSVIRLSAPALYGLTYLQPGIGRSI